MDIISNTLIGCDFKIAEEKYEFGPKLVYVGILIDTSRMVILFDAVQSKGFKMQLIEYNSKLKNCIRVRK
jgi:hypothetical protein